MPEVVLIGDSIRLGYQPFVAEALRGEAEVWGPEANGGTTVNILLHLHLWVKRRRPDVILVNAGLHDVRTDHYGGREILIPLAHHRDNVRRILRFCREHAPGARVAWATTTPVIEVRHHAAHGEWQDFDRYQADIDACNAAAAAVCAELAVPLIDLAAVVRGFDPSWITSDGVHYTAPGSRALAAAVVAGLRPLIGGG